MKKIIRVSALIVLIAIVGTCTSIFIINEGIVNKSNNEISVEAAIFKQGSRGTEVRTIQQKLKNWGYYKGSVDGIFGSQTRAAVKYFQQKNKLTTDGIVGNQTLRALGMSTSSQGGSSTSAQNNNDVYLLAKLIHSEARGESYIGQVAVGAVVLNRVKSPHFPNTISGVIYQPYAFTAVNDGQFNLEPNATAKKAASDALNGWDPSYGSIYYYNPAVATSKWIFSRKTVTTIGKHVFAI